MLAGLAALATACAGGPLRYDRGPLAAWADAELWDGEELFGELVVDARSGALAGAPPFRVRWPDGRELRSDHLDAVALANLGRPDRVFEQYGGGPGPFAGLPGRFPPGTRMICIDARGLCTALLRGELLYLRVAVAAGQAPDARPELGDADGRVYHRLPVTQAELVEILGEPEQLDDDPLHRERAPD